MLVTGSEIEINRVDVDGERKVMLELSREMDFPLIFSSEYARARPVPEGAFHTFELKSAMKLGNNSCWRSKLHMALTDQ